uniref:CCHC-type domain-containing protein n=1 Tax=Tanacetum cinerariifolium TaxID=118510 RepID=A0A6L2N2K1_TANCI|nr:hypothetical protein [Tanacetum cinerariifolium]
MPTSGQSLSAATIERLITQRVAEAMAAYKSNQDNQNGDGNPYVNAKGVVGLTRWFEKMEIVLHINNYPQKCQELMKLMTEMVPEEEDRVEKFIGGIPDNIQGNVIATGPSRLQDVVRITNNLMDQTLKGYAARNAENKRRFNNDPRDNCVQQTPLKRQNVARAYTVGNDKNKGYARILPLCDKCKLHHHDPCPVRCGNCKKVGHQARDCWASTTMTRYGCGGKGHTKRYFPKLGNQNRDGKAR